MIRYTLVCDSGHGFESWFRDSESYDKQAGLGLLTCPECGTLKVDKALMAPQVARKDREPPTETKAQPVALVAPQEQAMRERVRALRDALLENSEHVGKGFADEARKIHFGESEQRAIHGEATADDVRALIDEGVEVLPLPSLPDERH